MRTFLANLLGIAIFAAGWILYYRYRGTLRQDWPHVVIHTAVWWVLLQAGIRLFAGV